MSDTQPISQGTLVLEPGTLWMQLKARTESALQCGALQSIPTAFELIEQEGIQFLVRSLSNIARKEAAQKQQERKPENSGKEFNPFLPYEEDLFVTDISKTHLCLLNKFNVVDYHLLIVTRDFEEQESLLNFRDFEAMQAVLAEVDGLAFYNSGKVAGASQRHKHLQVVPLPLIPPGPDIPIAPALADASFQGNIGTIPIFQFVHGLAKLDSLQTKSPSEAAQTILETYLELLKVTGLYAEGEVPKSLGYNLLATRNWMLVVPRLQDQFESISINSLGFAGSFFVRNEEILNLLKKHGPLSILRNVCKPS